MLPNVVRIGPELIVIKVNFKRNSSLKLIFLAMFSRCFKYYIDF